MLGRKRAESREKLKKQQAKYVDEANEPRGNT